MSTIDVFNNYFDMLTQWQQQNPAEKNSQPVLLDNNEEEDPEFTESISNKTDSDNLDLSTVKETTQLNITLLNKPTPSIKENIYDIKNVLKINNNSETVNKTRKIRCFCDEEFQTVLELIPHLKYCEKSKDIKWNPFVKWVNEPQESAKELKKIVLFSDVHEALDLSKKSEINEVKELQKICDRNLESEVENVKWHCPECKFICSNKTLLLEHFDCEHKEGGSFSCTCGHMCDWLPMFLRHYIICNVAATDLQDEIKEESSVKVENSFSNFDIEVINKGSKSHSSYTKAYNNRWELPFGIFPNISHQFINNWLDPRIQETNNSSYNKCHWCQRAFSNSTELGNHMNHCSIKPLMKPFDKPFSMDFIKSGNMPFSHNSLPIPSFSDRHLSSAPLTVTGPPPETARHFKCSHCIKSFKSKALLDQHMHIHYPPKYTCRYCGKKYRWPPVFYHHQRTCKKRPAASSTAIVSSTTACLSLSNSNSTTLTTASSAYITNNSLNNPTSLYHQQHQCPPQNKSSPPNLLLNGPSPFIHNPILNFNTKPPFQSMFPVANVMTCICGHRVENFPSYLSHISCCPMFLHLSSKQRNEHSPPLIPNQMNSINFKPNTLQMDHNPFIHPNGLLLRPPNQQTGYPSGFPQPPLKSMINPSSSNHSTSISSNYLQSSDSIMAALASAVGVPKNTSFLPEAFTLNMNNSNTLLSSQNNNINSANSLLPSINNFDRLLSQESSRLSMQNSPPFNPALHSHHFHFGIGKSCSQCGKEFSSRLSLKQHIEGKHSAEGKYQCPSCSKRYRWGASYYYHKKSCIASKDSTSSHNPSPTMTEIIFD